MMSLNKLHNKETSTTTKYPQSFLEQDVVPQQQQQHQQASQLDISFHNINLISSSSSSFLSHIILIKTKSLPAKSYLLPLVAPSNCNSAFE